MIVIEPHSPEWATAYTIERDAIINALGPSLLEIEHIGSTAVPGLAAKPIIDIAIAVTDSTTAFDLSAPLAPMGFLAHKTGPQTHAVYVKERDGERTHILHAFDREQWELCNQRLLRDRLLRDPQARASYSELKMQLASEGLNPLEYTAAKTAFIQAIIDEERHARGLTPTQVWEK